MPISLQELEKQGGLKPVMSGATPSATTDKNIISGKDLFSTITSSPDPIKNRAAVEAVVDQSSSWMKKMMEAGGKAAKAIGNFEVGAGKSIFSTIEGMSSLGEKGLKGATKALLPKAAEKSFGVDKQLEETAAQKIIPEGLRTPTEDEKTGFQAGEVAQLFLPIGEETAAVTGITKILKEAKTLGAFGKALLGRAAVEGASLGAKRAMQTGDIKEGIEGAKTGAEFSAGFGALGKVASKAKPIISDVTSSVLANMIGKSPEHIKQAFRNPTEVAKYMSEGIIPLEVRNKAIEAVKSIRKKAGDAFSGGLSALQSKVPSNLLGKTTKETLDIAKAKKMVGAAVNDATEGLPGVLRKFRISVTKDGGLNFDKLNSSIVSSGEQNAIKKAYNTIVKQTNFTPQGVQDVAARIRALTKYLEGGKDVTSAVVGAIEDAYHKAIVNSYPGLEKIRSEYGATMKIVSGIEEVLNSVKNDVANPSATTSAVKRLSSLFNEDNEAYLNAIKRLETETGEDFLSKLAATEFKNVVPGSFGSRIAQAGLIAGSAATMNPWVLAVLPLFSPKAVGKITTGAGKAAKVIGPKLPAIGEMSREIIPKIKSVKD